MAYRHHQEHRAQQGFDKGSKQRQRALQRSIRPSLCLGWGVARWGQPVASKEQCVQNLLVAQISKEASTRKSLRGQDLKPCHGETWVLVSHSCLLPKASCSLCFALRRTHSLDTCVYMGGMQGLEPRIQGVVAIIHDTASWITGCVGVSKDTAGVIGKGCTRGQVFGPCVSVGAPSMWHCQVRLTIWQTSSQHPCDVGTASK